MVYYDLQTWHAKLRVWESGDDVQYVVKIAHGRQYAKIKMHIVPALGLASVKHFGSVGSVQLSLLFTDPHSCSTEPATEKVIYGCGYERLIYTAFVNLCNKHEDNALDAPCWTASTNIPSFQTNVNRLSFQAVPLV